ncbi:MAG: dTDP-4-dehydrorhamnose 3,5-epimerase family protein [Cyclobacteriaceae bacterium]
MAFIVLSETAEILYKTNEYHYPECEGGILFNDPSLNIDWKIPASEIITFQSEIKIILF